LWQAAGEQTEKGMTRGEAGKRVRSVDRLGHSNLAVRHALDWRYGPDLCRACSPTTSGTCRRSGSTSTSRSVPEDPSTTSTGRRIALDFIASAFVTEIEVHPPA
jgi:hypothetical protein